MDDLQYTYANNGMSNKLMRVTETPYGNAAQGFKDGTNSGDDYMYDNFGNMYKDQNKGITDITYNHLNLPKRISFATGGYISYIYNALGIKIGKTVTQADTYATTHYMGSFQYNNNTLQYIHTAEGYVRHTPPSNSVDGTLGAFDYVYNYTDHLGNIRLSYTLDPSDQVIKILEENHYYPFGMKHSYNTSKRDVRVDEAFLNPNLTPTENGNRRVTMVSNTGYQYKYNGKEYQDELGLAMYDYGARNYDPAIGRWMNIDPLAENSRRWTPYNYAYNNPIVFVDPDGMQAIWKPDAKGNLIAEKGDNTATLAKFLDREINDVANNFKKDGESIGEDYVFKEGETVVLNNNMTDSIENSNQTEEYSIETDCYNCHGAAISAVKGEEINPKTAGFKDLADPISSEVKELKSNLKEASSASEATFGKTILSFGDHSAVFYGTDNSGTEYYYSKNGATEKPGIFTLDQLKSIYPSNPNPKLFNYESKK